MNNVISPTGNNKDNLRMTCKAAIWWSKTLFKAFMLPYYVVGAAIAFSLLIGVSFADVREIVVSFAGLDFTSWAEIGQRWKIASLSISAVYVAHCVVSSKLVFSFLKQQLGPTLIKIDSSISTKRDIIVFVLTLAIICLCLSSLITSQQKNIPDSISTTKPFSPVSASITLSSGEILSGEATVTKEDNRYIVSFKK